MEKTRFHAEYVVHKKALNGKWYLMADECKAGPYEQATVLKVDTKNILEYYLKSHNCKDGEYLIDATIELNGNWYDSDTFIVEYKSGKVVAFKEV